MSNTAVSFKNVRKSFNGATNHAIDNLSFDIPEGEFVTILGTSGSGKTTTLKMVNRLIEPDAGEITVYNQSVEAFDVNQLRRKIGYVVQQIGLFPHYTIEKNIGAVPELLGWEKARITQRVQELMELVQLPYEEYATRFPRQLSGGQQQRVGVARALAANPDIMLLDEPFGAVDAITRKELQAQIKNLHQRLEKKTFLFVTHDINEAFALGTKVMIMREGNLDQFDTPENIIRQPKTAFVKQLLDTVYAEEEIWRKYR
ncbi:ABC transporter ATP-binding protein [Enterococcus sp. 669A]|uniref:ABC transporter ATP-binding protein n=1 Tax=Candidatus Enterococcus moelleringii TaxID=2815325 RepID=A0ABS3LAF3_9ENTE|nr:ABC transporter ATP-binding protein [Enterococcus sp. 669A]MBO1305716.1 ABC transporter ATP-binding protein [Enterococcus sp. 669A]